MHTFVGRKAELQRLKWLTEKKVASFIVINGRRRIGKSRLIKEFSKDFKNFYSFIGLPPEDKTTPVDQLNEFSRQIAREFNTVYAQYADWSDALYAVGERVSNNKLAHVSTLILFDEISWMGSKDPNFLGKIKNFWDLQLKENNKLIFVICGSASSWIEKNILSSTGFVGRISYVLTLGELSLSECSQFWPRNISTYEKIKILSVTGGVPKYLEEIDPKYTAEENIKRLAFSKGGFLVDEFERIFADIFLRDSKYYKEIVRELADGQKDIGGLCNNSSLKNTGRLYEYLDELELAGFVTKDYTWNLKTGHDLKLNKYRLSDNYVRFYLKYLEKNLAKINRNIFSLKTVASLPAWDSVMGLQFENLVINNKDALHKVLLINPNEVICSNPFFQRKNNRQRGCQIDYMVQTKFNSLYVCEIKYSKNLIGMDTVREVQEKISAIKVPKNMSCRPVLIHVSGVTEEVLDADYFANIVDFSSLCNCAPPIA